MNKSSYFKMIASAAAGLRRESGSIAVETALGITFLVSTAVILSDMHQIGIERERLEAGAGSIAGMLRSSLSSRSTGSMRSLTHRSRPKPVTPKSSS